MTEKLRVYQLAREMLTDSKVILRILRQIGAEAKNHMSTLDDEVAEKVRGILTGKLKLTDEAKTAPSEPRVRSQAERKAPAATRKAAAPEKKTEPKPKVQAAEEEEKSSRKSARPQPTPQRREEPHAKSTVPREPRTSEETKSPAAGRKAGTEKREEMREQRPDSQKGPRASSRPGGDERSRGQERRTGGYRGKMPSSRGPRRGGRGSKRSRPKKTVVNRPNSITIEGPLPVKELASKMGLLATDLIKKLIGMGIMASINQEVDADTAVMVAEQLEYEVVRKQPEMSMEERFEREFAAPDDPDKIRPRPPVVTVMGHVDHGKTSLLDAIRHTNVTAGEAGGITQHIGASVVEYESDQIVFLDTPGHEAFTSMRMRGARVTDVAVLVVAADDGVMPQTIEAINHARAAQVPIIVAVNKVDRPNARPDRVQQQLSEHGLIPEEWGGDTVFVEVSATEGTGIDRLLEMLLLVAELQDLQADPQRRARGTVIEAELDKGRGPVATVLVSTGTLEIGDAFVTGTTSGRVRAMSDAWGRRITTAGPSTPVEVIGMDDVPEAGDAFLVIEEEKTAKDIAASRQLERRQKELGAPRRMTLDDLFNRVKEGEVAELNLVIKTDTQGSVEAVRQALDKLSVEEVRPKLIHSGVGAIRESDIMLAAASDAIVIGFNVRPDANARRVAESEHIDVRTYRVIYEAMQDIEAAMKGLLKPKYREVIVGRVEVRQVFKVPRAGMVAGSYVLEGKIERSSSVRVIRDGVIVYEGKLDSLKRFKDDVREVVAGYECGVGLEQFQDIKEGDVLEVFAMEEVKSA